MLASTSGVTGMPATRMKYVRHHHYIILPLFCDVICCYMAFVLTGHKLLQLCHNVLSLGHDQKLVHKCNCVILLILKKNLPPIVIAMGGTSCPTSCCIQWAGRLCSACSPPGWTMSTGCAAAATGIYSCGWS